MPKGVQGFQKGHPPFWTKGNPGGRGNSTRGPDRKGHSYQPGHPAYYRGGSVVGHAPTNDGKHLGPPPIPPSDPKSPLHKHRFGQPGVPKPKNNGMPATASQRNCMEAIQNLDSLDDKVAIKRLMQRFPPGMVRRLVALQRSAEDPGDNFFVQSQRTVREILIAPKRRNEGEDGAEQQKQADTIHVFEGRIDVPMPGAAKEPDTGAPPDGG